MRDAGVEFSNIDGRDLNLLSIFMIINHPKLFI